jgi:hypothetical protein
MTTASDAMSVLIYSLLLILMMFAWVYVPA